MRNLVVKNKRIIMLLTSLVFLSGCATATTPDAPAAAGGDFAAAWEAADARRKEAGKLGAEWRDTGKMLDQARKASDKGEADKAMKLVAKAQEQSEDAIAQYERESAQWATRVPQ